MKYYKKLITLLLLGASLSLISCKEEEPLPTVVTYEIDESTPDESFERTEVIEQSEEPYIEPVRITHNPKEVDINSLEYCTREQKIVLALEDTPIYNTDGVDIADFVKGRNYIYVSEDENNYIFDYFGIDGIVSKEKTLQTTKRVIKSEMINKGCMKEVTTLYNDSKLTEPLTTLDKLEFVEIYNEVDNSYLVQSRDEVGYISKNDVELMEKDSAVIDINNQEMRIYEGNELKVYTPVVTGTKGTSRRSDEGLFTIRVKYSTPNGFDIQPGYKVKGVLYYNGGEGIHTANAWRSRYGGNIYLKNGSHGCINTPDDKFAELFEVLDLKEYVLVYTKNN